VLNRNPFGPVEVVPRARQIVGHPFDCRQADPGAASLGIACRRRHCILIGALRVRDSTKVMQDVALATDQRGAPRGVPGQYDAPFD
jgi:hypothetical protein